MKNDDEFNKQVDLDPSEYTYRGKHEPAFGPNAIGFVVMLALSFPLSAIITYVVRGKWPYWAPALFHEAAGLAIFVGGGLIVIKLFNVLRSGFSGRQHRQ